jgi:hypothetical protein
MAALASSIESLYHKLNHEYAVWAIVFVLILLGLYKVSAMFSDAAANLILASGPPLPILRR